MKLFSGQFFLELRERQIQGLGGFFLVVVAPDPSSYCYISVLKTLRHYEHLRSGETNGSERRSAIQVRSELSGRRRRWRSGRVGALFPAYQNANVVLFFNVVAGARRISCLRNNSEKTFLVVVFLLQGGLLLSQAAALKRRRAVFSAQSSHCCKLKALNAERPCGEDSGC